MQTIQEKREKLTVETYCERFLEDERYIGIRERSDAFQDFRNRLDSWYFDNLYKIMLTSNIELLNLKYLLKLAKGALVNLANFKGYSEELDLACQWTKLVIKRCNNAGFY